MVDDYANDISSGRRAGVGFPAIRALERFSTVERIAIAAMTAAILARLVARPDAPFWLDEAATGAIVGQPSFAEFWQEVYWSVSSPLYFLILRPWQEVFGLSNAALRAPSVLFSMAAPLCVAFARVPGLSRADRLVWAAILALWIPGIGYAQDARCYALELLFATLQTLAFAELLRVTTFRNTAIWITLSGLTIATHYDAAVLGVTQGLLFVGLKRGDAVKRWPAALLLAPVAAVILWQGPETARFMQPDTTWYKIHDEWAVLRDFVYLWGNACWIIAAPALLIAAAFMGRSSRSAQESMIPNRLLWVGFASVLGGLILIGLATQRPILTVRYLAPFVPGCLLAYFALLRILARGAEQAAQACLVSVAFVIFAIWLAMGAKHTDSVVEPLNYERASARVMEAGAKSVVFTWDNPNARAMHLEQVAEYGRFFFRRAGYPIEVVPVALGANDDPNVRLLAAARPAGSAIIWVYDTWVDGTSAARHPPAISELDPRFRCEHARDQAIGIVTCLPSDARP